MATFWQALSEVSKERWLELYKAIVGEPFIPPYESKNIECEPKLESLEEIDKLMREVPNPTRRE